MTNSERMLEALERQDLTAAQAAFQQALLVDDQSVLLELAAYLEGIGFLGEASQIYNRYAPDKPELFLALAQIAYEDGLVEQAFAHLEEISPSSSYYVQALLTKADFYQVEGLADVAREKLLAAKDLSDDPIILFALGEIAMELTAYQEAIGYYVQLDNREILDVTGISTYQRIGLAYAYLGRFEAAVEFLEKAVELAYDDQTVFELAALLLEQKDYQKANLYFKQLKTMNPDFEGISYLYARSLHGEHRIEDALEEVRAGLNHNPFDGQLLLLASQYSYELHDQVASEDYLLEAKEVVEDDNEVILRLSTLYLEQERYEEVIQLTEDDLDQVLAKWNRAKAYQALEREIEALEVFTDLHADLAENPEFLSDFIAFLRQVGQEQRAKELTQVYLDLVPDDLTMQEFLNQE